MESTGVFEEKVPLKSSISISAADASVALVQGIIAAGLMRFFVEIRGLDPWFNFLAWMIFLVWNSINDPLLGYVADRTKSDLGRRIPYIRYGAPFLAIGYILCWVNWPGTSGTQLGLIIQLVIALFFYDTLYTAVATALYIMPYEIAVSNKARTGIFVWKTIFSVIAIAGPLILLPIIEPGPGDDVTGYMIFHTTLAIVMAFIVVISTFFYKENNYTKHEEQLPFIEALKQTFRNRSFISFEMISFTSVYLLTGLPIGLLYYLDEFATSFLGIIVALLIGAAIGLYIFITQNSKWGVKRSMLILIASFGLGCLTILIGGFFEIPTILGMVGVGIGMAGSFIMIPLMNGDVIDYDEKETSLRREGMYAGVNSFVTKPAISVAEGIIPLILVAFGFVSGLPAGSQSSSAQVGILVAWLLLPVILLGLSFLVIWKGYNLEGDEWEETKQELAEIHAKKEEEFLRTLAQSQTDKAMSSTSED